MNDKTVRVFILFLLRDCKTYVQQFKNHIINFAFIYPTIFSLSSAYIQGRSYFGSDNSYMITVSFVGNIMLTLLILAYKLNIPLLFDLEENRYIDYQIVQLKPQLILLERIAFSTFLSFIVLLPFFPISILLLQNHFDSANTSWPSVFLILFLGTLFCCTYSCFMACALPSKNKIGMMWRRINLPLFILGGYLTPWYVINTFSPLLGKLVLLNPLIYFTEGIRAAFLGGNIFFPVSTCSLLLIASSVFLYGFACYFFKKRTDHL